MPYLRLVRPLARGALALVALLGACSEGASPSGQPASAALDDEFEGDLAKWQTLNPNDATIEVTNGHLRIEPAAHTLWYQARSSALLFQLVEGDFVVTTDAAARGLAMPDLPPQPMYRLGGVMARDPDGSAENYVFIVVGADADNASVETKSTTNDKSQYQGPVWPSAQADLRICRLGSSFRLLIRAPGGAWAEQDRFDRPDLPEVLQVGPTAYANNDPADLQVTFDAIHFGPAQSDADCTSDM